jgi:hypothetical protein
MALVVPLACGDQVAPPSVVRRIVPGDPTAVQVFASGQETLMSPTLVDWLTQVPPPSLVRRIVPGEPGDTTAVQVLASGQERPNPVLFDTEFCCAGLVKIFV